MRVRGAFERQVGGGLQPFGGGREPEDAKVEAFAQRGEQRRVGAAELIGHERAPRLAAVVIGHLHAARVVDQDADEILLRHRDLEEQHRSQQREKHDKEETDADSEQHGAIAARERGHLPVGPQRVQRSAATNAAVSHIDRLAPKANLPCSKTRYWYLNRNVKIVSNTEARL